MRAHFFLLAAALALPACAQDPDEEPDAPAETHKQALDPGFNAEQERAVKKQWQARTPGKRVEKIDWAEAKNFRAASFDQLTVEQRSKLESAPVPALLPDRPELLKSATITGGEHWYAASLDGEGHSVYVSGTRLVTVVDGLEVADERPGLDKDFRITRTDGIVSLSVNAFGAAYVIEVECARPSEDARCLEDDYAVELANQLALLGGGQQ